MSCADEGECDLPNGSRLYWKSNEAGGRSYISDEIGGGVHVWDSSLVDPSTLLMAMAKEAEIVLDAQRQARKSPVAATEYVDGAHCVIDSGETW